jgi:adenylate cyclase
VARTGVVRSLTLHDAEGRLFYDAFGHFTPPADVDSVLRTGVPRAVADEEGTEFRFVEPLPNAKPCQSCHGSGEKLRGAIEIRLNTTSERAELARLQHASAISGVATILLVFILLAIGLHHTVIRPVRAIGSVADLVGAGQLDSTVDIRTRDEMGRLGGRVNEMVRGLRHKLELSKFVSHDTLREVEANVGAVARGGERRRIAVVFSDIRGFTQFAESHEPEAVVAMLNRYLHAQADVVVQYGGDIDKFVGDEIMARFTGPDAALRASRAAVGMVAAVEALDSAPTEAVERAAVGIGVNVGDAILGAMGAEHRMDYTAIGDTVNIAARLCTAAAPGEVLVTEAVQRELQNVTDLVLSSLEPMHLKGKQEAVAVYRVTARRTLT